MTKIKIMSVRDEDIPYINEWAKQNNVDVDLTKAIDHQTLLQYQLLSLLTCLWLNQHQHCFVSPTR
jgi:hypothetical protein